MLCLADSAFKAEREISLFLSINLQATYVIWLSTLNSHTFYNNPLHNSPSTVTEQTDFWQQDWILTLTSTSILYQANNMWGLYSTRTLCAAHQVVSPMYLGYLSSTYLGMNLWGIHEHLELNKCPSGREPDPAVVGVSHSPNPTLNPATLLEWNSQTRRKSLHHQGGNVMQRNLRATAQ